MNFGHLEGVPQPQQQGLVITMVIDQSRDSITFLQNRLNGVTVPTVFWGDGLPYTKYGLALQRF